MSKLTLNSLNHCPLCFRLGDIIFLPGVWRQYASLEKRIEAEMVSLRFRREGPHDEEPEYVKSLSLMTRRQVHREAAIIESFAVGCGTWNPLGIMANTNFGFGYIIPEGGILEHVTRALNIFRLANIKQLGRLTQPVDMDDDPWLMIFDGYRHSRYVHVLDTVAIATLIGHNLGLQGKTLETLQVAAISHDVLTPSGGDSTKLIDSEGFNEDTNYPEVFKSQSWQTFQEKFGLDEGLLHQTIMGKGLLGQILDISDKLSYTGNDTQGIIRETQPSFLEREGGVIFEKIKALVQDNETELFGRLWGTVCEKDREVFFSDTELLRAFLTIRALMFRFLYYNPNSRFIEDVLYGVVLKYLYKKGLATKQALLRGGDNEAEYLIEGFIGTPIYDLISSSEVLTLRFRTQKEAEDAESLLEGDWLTRTVEMTRRSDSGARKFKVRDKDGNIVSFVELFPKEARGISEIMFSETPFFFYAIKPRPDLYPRLKEAWGGVQDA